MKRNQWRPRWRYEGEFAFAFWIVIRTSNWKMIITTRTKSKSRTHTIVSRKKLARTQHEDSRGNHTTKQRRRDSTTRQATLPYTESRRVDLKGNFGFRYPRSAWRLLGRFCHFLVFGLFCLSRKKSCLWGNQFKNEVKVGICSSRNFNSKEFNFQWIFFIFDPTLEQNDKLNEMKYF